MSKIYLNFRLDLRWLMISAVPPGERLHFLFRKYRAMIGGHDRVRFLGAELCYDNRFTPALLVDYVEEVRDLLYRIGPLSPRTVLDVGANIGQFAHVLQRFRPDLLVTSLEPNPAAYECLRRNVRNRAGWRCLRVGVDERARRVPFFVVPGKSCQGSLHPGNATEGLIGGRAEQIEVDLVALDVETRRRLDFRDHYDLIKIDVEGAERGVLAALENLSWNFIYVELAANRAGALTVVETIEILRSGGHAPRLLWASQPKGKGGVFTALIERRAPVSKQTALSPET